MTAKEISLRSRLSKFGEFFRNPRLEGLSLHPFPWIEPGHPYYLLRRGVYDDGHGGYTRLHRFDADGVPYTPIPSGRLYHPLVVARYALRMLEVASATGDPEAAIRARRVLPALIDSGRRTGCWGAGADAAEMSSDDPSAPVQGCVISALLRLCEGRPPADVAALLERAAARLMGPVQLGGCRSTLEGGPFLEEAPGKPLAQILNGCLTGLFGLYDLADSTRHGEAARLAREIQMNLARTIGRFVAPGGWSYYALDAGGHPYRASLYYHAAVIPQVRIVALRSGHASLWDAIAKWESALHSAPRRAVAATVKAAQVLWVRDLRRRRLDVCP